jgi:beta-phosphoglucomutase-like phosphatase (HAD superfamily)
LFNIADRRLQLRAFFNGHAYLSHELKNIRSKPQPDIFVHAAREIGVDSTECLVFEDAPLGVVAGWAAGARVVGFTKTFGESLYNKAVVAAKKAKTVPSRFIAIPDFLDESYMRVYHFARAP